MRKSFLTGNAIAEYGLISALVGLSSIGALFTLGDTLNTTLQGLVDMGGSNTMVATLDNPPGYDPNAPAPAPTTNPTNSSPTQVGPGATLPPPTAGQEKACFTSGWCVNVPVVNAGKLDSTTGAMGTTLTHDLASVFTQIAQQLQASGETDSTLFNMITKLANNGHTLGDLQQAVIDQCPPGEQCTSSVGPLGGKDGTVNEALADVSRQTNTFQLNYDQVTAYLRNNPDALPPEIVNIINLEAYEILNIASAYPKISTSEDGGLLKVTEQWDYAYNVELTHQSADTICENAGNSSQCVRKQ